MLCSRQSKIGFLTFVSLLCCDWVPTASADECLLAVDVDGLLSIFDILDVGATSDIDALACGTGASAIGTDAIAFGTNALVNGEAGIALGFDTEATGDGAIAIGANLLRLD